MSLTRKVLQESNEHILTRDSLIKLRTSLSETGRKVAETQTYLFVLMFLIPMKFWELHTFRFD